MSLSICSQKFGITSDTLTLRVSKASLSRPDPGSSAHQLVPTNTTADSFTHLTETVGDTSETGSPTVHNTHCDYSGSLLTMRRQKIKRAEPEYVIFDCLVE